MQTDETKNEGQPLPLGAVSGSLFLNYQTKTRKSSEQYTQEGLNKYRYSLILQYCSSSKLGNCEVCGKYANDMFTQIEESFYNFSGEGILMSGWRYVNNKFGHEDCLIKIRKGTKI